MKQEWSDLATDIMLDEFLVGTSPSQIAKLVLHSPEAIKKHLTRFFRNTDNQVIDYQPFKRISRIIKPWTENERLLHKALVKHQTSLKSQARVLQRDISELSKDGVSDKIKTNIQKRLAPTLDLIWAHRYIYFVYKAPIISDTAYDDLVKEEIEFGGGEKAFAKIKLHEGWPGHIKSLALYFVGKAEMENK